jgi:D-methionine transport system ATP-binding protein
MTETLKPNPQLRLDRVSFVAPVGSQSLLKELSVDIFPGDLILLAGASAAGKTLFLQLLNRRLEPTSGTIYLDDRDIRQIPTLKLRRSITLVPQEPKLLGMTVEQTLAYPLELRGVKQSEIKQRLQEWRDCLQIPKSWMSQTETQLSLAQRQQVAITRALAIQPTILLLDDPLIFLDCRSSARILAVLIELSHTHNMTVVVSARQLDRLHDFSQRVLYLHQGELRQDLQGNRLDWTALTAAIEQTELQAQQEWDEDQ